MTRHLIITTISIALLTGCNPPIKPSQPDATSEQQSSISQTVTLPKYFVAQTLDLAHCSLGYKENTHPMKLRQKVTFAEKYLKDGNWFQGSTSLTVTHDTLSDWWADYPWYAYAALERNDTTEIAEIISQLTHYADIKLFVDIPTASVLYDQPCWSDGNKKSICPAHLAQHTSFAIGTLLQTAILLKPHMADDDLSVLQTYFASAWDQNLKFIAYRKLGRNKGFYEWGNGGLNALLYAHWTNDATLLTREVEFRVRQIDQLVNDGGYIDNNSYRGVRAYFYHTLGVDSILSYALVARAHGIDLFQDKRLTEKLKNMGNTVMLGHHDYDAFRAIGNRGSNLSNDPSDTRRTRHSLAKNLPLILEKEFDLPANVLVQSRDNSLTMDKIGGFHAACIYSGHDEPSSPSSPSL